MVKRLLGRLSNLQEFIFTIASILYSNSFFKLSLGPKNIFDYNATKHVAVVANGPRALTDYKSLGDEKVDFIVTVNDGVCSDFFFEVKPRYHFLMDPFFFNGSNSRVGSISKELKKVDWSFSLVVPVRFFKAARLIYEGVNIICINTNEIRGNSMLAIFAFQFRLGMPRVQNVLIAVISYLIWNRVSRIYLCGASHDWSRYMEVDKNKLYLRSHHYFDEGSDRKLWLDANGRNYSVHEAFHKLSLMFLSYNWLAMYLRKYSEGTSVIVKSKDTLIDSF